MQAEASHLLRSLELQKEDSKRQSENARKKQEELAANSEIWRTELDSLRAKARQYTDYDEIKRELEIMKVRLIEPVHFLDVLIRVTASISSLQVLK